MLHFLPRLGLPFTLIGNENRAFRKRCSNRRNLKTPTLRFRGDRKNLKTEHLENNFSARVFLKYKSEMTLDCCIFKVLRGT